MPIDPPLPVPVVDNQVDHTDHHNAIHTFLNDEAETETGAQTKANARELVPLDLVSAPHGIAVLTVGGDDYVIVTTRSQAPDKPRIWSIPADAQHEAESVVIAEATAGMGIDAVVADPSRGVVYALLADTDRIRIIEFDPTDLSYSIVVNDITDPSSSVIQGGPSIATDETSVFVATYTNPAKVVKYDIATWARTGVATITGRRNAHGAMFDGGTFDVGTDRLFVTGSWSPAWIAKLNPADMSFSVTEIAGRGLITDDFALTDTHLWVGLEDGTSPEVFVFDKFTMAQITSIATGGGDGSFASHCYGVFWDDFNWDAIWTVHASGQVTIIDQTTMEPIRMARNVPIAQWGDVNEFAVLPDGRQFVTSFSDKTFSQWKWPWTATSIKRLLSAVDIQSDPVGAVSATNVQAALAELESEKAGTAIANTFSAGPQTFKPGSASAIAAIFQGEAAQTGDLARFQDSAAAVLASVSSAGAILANPGTSSLPGLAFQGDPDTGFHRSANNTIQMIMGGAAYHLFLTDQHRMRSDVVLGWTSSSSVTAAIDTVVYRHSADKLKTDDNLIVASRIAAGRSDTISGHQFNSTAATAATVPIVGRAAAAQTANLLELQDSAGAVLTRAIAGGGFDTINQNIRIRNAGDTSSLLALVSDSGGALVQMTKLTALPNAPGSGLARLYFRDGTDAGTLKLVARAGAAGAETTILDNIPQS